MLILLIARVGLSLRPRESDAHACSDADRAADRAGRMPHASRPPLFIHTISPSPHARTPDCTRNMPSVTPEYEIESNAIELAAEERHRKIEDQRIAVWAVGAAKKRTYKKKASVAAEPDVQIIDSTVDGRRRLQRRANVLANTPVGEYRPKINKDGEIPMGSQQCVADARTHKCCMKRTKHGCYCWMHRAQLDGLKIAKSNIKGAGQGLFTTRAFKAGERLIEYTGDTVSTDSVMYNLPKAQGYNSRYVVSMSDQVSIDAARTNTADGRMINAPPSGTRPNSRFGFKQTDPKGITIYATRGIKAGDEILLSYGRTYWTRGDSRMKPITLRGIEVSEVSRVTVEEMEFEDESKNVYCINMIGGAGGRTLHDAIKTQHHRAASHREQNKNAATKEGICKRLHVLHAYAHGHARA